jgi:hypothetical protein
MLALVALKDFDGYKKGDVIQLSEEEYTGHIISSKSATFVECPVGTKSASMLYSVITEHEEKWINSEGEELLTKPVDTSECIYLPAHQFVQVFINETAAEEFNAALEERRYVKRIEYAKAVIARISYLNSKKNLTQEQIVGLANTYAPVMNLLNTGSYPTVLSVLEGITPDGIITQSDKDSVVGMIQKYLETEE